MQAFSITTSKKQHTCPQEYVRSATVDVQLEVIHSLDLDGNEQRSVVDQECECVAGSKRRSGDGRGLQEELDDHATCRKK